MNPTGRLRKPTTTNGVRKWTLKYHPGFGGGRRVCRFYNARGVEFVRMGYTEEDAISLVVYLNSWG